MKRRLHINFGKRSVRAEVDRELQCHIDMKVEELIALGVHPELALQEARAAFGDTRAIASQCRSIRRSRVRSRQRQAAVWNIGQDVRVAFRSLKRSPAFTLAIVVTLALGIGANTAVFSLLNGVLIQPLPYERGGDLLRLRQQAQAAGAGNINFSPLEVVDYRSQSTSLTDVVEYHSMPFILLGLEEPHRVQTGVVSAQFFDLMGVRPLLGRSFLPGEDQVGAEPVLILSNHTWRELFDSDQQVIGREVEMNDRIHIIVGVLPEIPHHPNRNDVYMPVAACPFRNGERTSWPDTRTARGLTVFSRIAPGHGLPDVQADLAAIAGRLHREYPEAYPESAEMVTHAVPLRDELVSNARPSLLVLLGAAGFLLLIVTANVANLTLARLVRREREMAIRATLGAGRLRLFRQLFTESVILTGLAGLAGVLLAYLGLDVLQAFLARLTPRAAEVAIDADVWLFAGAVSLATALLLSLLPVLPRGANLAGQLKEGGPGIGQGGRLRTRSVLIVSQVAVSFVMLVGAGLMLRTFVNLITAETGFDQERVLTARVDLDWNRYVNSEMTNRFADDLRDRLLAVPGVKTVAYSQSVPLNGQGPILWPVRVEGRTEEEQAIDQLRLEVRPVSREYFATIGVPLLRGEIFDVADADVNPIPVTVNHTMAQEYFGGEALGRQLFLGGSETPAVVVGIVGDTRHQELASEIVPAIYVPQKVLGWRDLRVLLRGSLDAVALGLELKRSVSAIDPNQPVTELRTLEEIRRVSMTSHRVIALLVGSFAVLALVITAAGIGGVIAYSVSQRTREIGIRMALGADRGEVLRMVLQQALRMAALGLAIGLAGALVMARGFDTALSSAGILFGVSTVDLVTFSIVPLLLTAVAFTASYAPARRATTIDPMDSLRSE